MALPAEFDTVQVYGKYLNLDGSAVVGYLTFEASPVILKAAVSKDLIVPVVLQVNLDETGYFSINLPVTDDPDINPHDWTYKVTEGFGSRRVYNVPVREADKPSINIYDLAPISLSNGEFYLQGDPGPAGPPAIITSGKPAGTVGGDGQYALDPATGILYRNTSGVWDNGTHLSAADIAAHAALATTHGVAGVLVGTTDTQVLSNKILQAPAVTGGLSTDSVHATGAATVDGNLTVGGTATLPSITGPVTVNGSETVTGALTVQGSTTLAGTTLTGNLDLGTHDATAHNVTASNLLSAQRVSISGTPSAATDAATKGYVDTTAGDTNATASTLVRRDSAANVFGNLFGGTAQPTASNHLTRKDYVDNHFRPQILSITASYTPGLSDEGKLVQVNTASATTFTLPTNATVPFPIGAIIDVQNINTGVVSIAGAGAVVLQSPSNSTTISRQFATVRLQKTATDTWVLQHATVAGATSVATPNTLVLRDGSGNFGMSSLAIATPEATTALILDQQAADPALPATANAVNLWKANDHGLYVNETTYGKRRMKVHWGSSTGFPVAALAGDTILRSDIGTNGTLFQYTGNTSYGITGWIAEGPIICTAATAPGALYAGVQTYATDTGAMSTWTGSVWSVWDTVSQTFTPTLGAAGGTPGVGNGSLMGRYRRMGRSVWLKIYLQVGTTTNGGTGTVTFSIPAAISQETTTGEQWIPLKMYTNGNSQNWIGMAWIAGTTVTPYAPASQTNTSVLPVASANSGGATGTGTPTVAGAFTLASGSNINIEGVYELANG